MKRAEKNKKTSAGQPKLRPSRLDDYANKFYQLGRAQARLNQERRDIEQQNMLGAMQRIMLLQAQQKVRDLISELNRRQLELLSIIGQVAPPQLPMSPQLPEPNAGPGLPPEMMMQQNAGMPMGGQGLPVGMPMPNVGQPEMPPMIPPGMPPEMLPPGGGMPQGLPPEALSGVGPPGNMNM